VCLVDIVVRATHHLQLPPPQVTVRLMDESTLERSLTGPRHAAGRELLRRDAAAETMMARQSYGGVMALARRSRVRVE